MTGLFLVLAAYVIFVEIPRDQKEANPDAVLLLPGFNANEVVRIQYAGPDGYTLEKTNGQWVFSAPRPWRVDQSTLWPLLDDLAELTVLQSLQTMTPRLEQYGLNPPHGGALVIETDEDRWHISFGLESNIQLGRETSAESYVIVNSNPPVHLVETFKINRLRKPRDDFRHRHILDLDLNGLQEIEIRFRGSLLRLIRDDGLWLVEERGERKPADPQKLLPLLRELFEFTVSDFVSDHASAAQYGILPGSSYIKLVDGHGSRVLRFGRAVEGKVYCSFVSHGEIWSVLEDTFNRFDVKPSDFLPDPPTDTEAGHEGEQVPLP
jgi:hypothetical protein